MVQLPICSRRMRAVALLTIGFPASWSMSAFAVENRASLADFQHITVPPAPDEGGLSASEFDVRWTGGHGHTLTFDGAIVPAASPEARARREAESHQLDVRDASAALEANRPLEVSDSKQIGNIVSNQVGAPSSAVPSQCGPSPLTADAVRELVVETAGRHGVDQDLAVAVTAVESDFDRSRNSPKGARGPMQLMPATAVRFAVADPCDPATNIDAGVRYLSVLLEEFKSPILAIAAYNAGEDRIYEYGGIPPFPETVSYVAKVMNHQLGLPMPRRKRVKAATGGNGSDEVSDRGVIVTNKRRQWVAGVMQF